MYVCIIYLFHAVYIRLSEFPFDEFNESIPQKIVSHFII